LQLAKRTVSESPDVTSPSAGGDAKASPFGAARPIDTAAKEREIADKRDQLLREKKDADEKAKEERRLAKEAKEAKEAAAKEAADKAAADAEAAKEEAAKAEAAKAEIPEEKTEAPVESEEAPTESSKNGNVGDQKLPIIPKEGAQNPKSRAVESGNWRSASGDQRQGRGGYVNAPSRGRGDSRGGRGGAPRGPRGNYEGRGSRTNGNPPAAAAQQPSQAASATPEVEAAPAQDPDGWTTVSTKGRRK
jgi:translation initiation factor 4B